MHPSFAPEASRSISERATTTGPSTPCRRATLRSRTRTRPTTRDALSESAPELASGSRGGVYPLPGGGKPRPYIGVPLLVDLHERTLGRENPAGFHVVHGGSLAGDHRSLVVEVHAGLVRHIERFVFEVHRG